MNILTTAIILNYSFPEGFGVNQINLVKKK